MCFLLSSSLNVIPVHENRRQYEVVSSIVMPLSSPLLNPCHDNRSSINHTWRRCKSRNKRRWLTQYSLNCFRTTGHCINMPAIQGKCHCFASILSSTYHHLDHYPSAIYASFSWGVTDCRLLINGLQRMIIKLPFIRTPLSVAWYRNLCPLRHISFFLVLLPFSSFCGKNRHSLI